MAKDGPSYARRIAKFRQNGLGQVSLVDLLLEAIEAEDAEWAEQRAEFLASGKRGGVRERPSLERISLPVVDEPGEVQLTWNYRGKTTVERWWPALKVPKARKGKKLTRLVPKSGPAGTTPRFGYWFIANRPAFSVSAMFTPRVVEADE